MRSDIFSGGEMDWRGIEMRDVFCKVIVLDRGVVVLLIESGILNVL